MFCVVKKYEALGRAKIIDTSDTKCTVEYFDSPENSSIKALTVPKESIVRKKLGANTRIYFRHEATGQWLVGRVLQDQGDGVEVRFSDKNDTFLEYENLFVRCNRPISDPVDYLANVITETPQYAESRSGFLESYISQRGAAWGMSALLSSVVALEPHQINVVRRILSDPSQRYLLADEVGLGKTIEAGVVIRQAVLDDPRNHFVVVLVPETLKQQWRQELILKFGLIDFIDSSVFVLAQNSLAEIKSKLARATLLVIDEAHHVAAGDDDAAIELYDLVRSYSKQIERLLLLSATPVLRNEQGFLRMLHLLDDVVYDLKDEAGFRDKIKHRQVLAEAVASLDPQNVLYLDSVLDELAEKLPNDERLRELVKTLKTELVGLPDEDDPDLIESIRVLRAHLSETYRLHRRILRNRRKQVIGITPSRSGARVISVRGSQMGRLESLLEDWRINALSTYDGNSNEELSRERLGFFAEVLNALFTAPDEIKLICNRRLADIHGSSMMSIREEVSVIQEIVSLEIYQDWLNSRIDCLRHEIPELLGDDAKVVIFCSLPLTADAVFEGLRSGVGCKDAIVRHDVINISWEAFNSNSSTRIIVCDCRAEEGINLQGGQKIVIHFDLPMEPNRIEQRMGRVDRYGSGDAIQSIILLDKDSKYQTDWFALLDTALEVFGRSISSLQYLIEGQMHQLRVALFLEGAEAIDSLRESMGGEDGKVSKEMRLIDHQDGLDELTQLAESDLECLIAVDSDWKSIRASTLNWACDTLMFGSISESNVGNSLSVDTPFRFQYKVPGNGGQATLIALSGFMDDFLGALDYEDRRSTSAQPLSYPHLSKRQTAVLKGTRLLRYGDDFIEALKSFSDSDDRGRSYAMWRQYYEGLTDSDSGMYFRFDFLIETNMEKVDAVLSKSAITLDETSQSAITRRGDALFAPQVVRIWINEEGEEPSTNFIKEYLLPCYDKIGKNRSYIDTNLKSLRLRSLMDRAPDIFSNWNARCIRMRDQAKEILVGRVSLAENIATAIKRARIEDEVRAAQLLTRVRLLEGVEAESERMQLSIEEKLNHALYNGIQDPSIKVDVAGVVILSRNQFQHI